MHSFRTHTCGQLTKEHKNQTVKISGWVHNIRNHGNLVFVDVRDHYGITQCVADSSNSHFDTLSSLSLESVITITGQVVERDHKAVNLKIATGEVEIIIVDVLVESVSDVLPLQVNSNESYPEATRLTYRFLDLRKEKLHNNIVMRSKVISWLRQKMTNQGFLEFQTPILTASSPEGARDYLVPSRVHAGKFYALPQAPQMFKQLLMVSGFDRYFQIAPCFRDEDARADRSPGEFYQLDIEMSFVTQQDVFDMVEPVLYELFTEFSEWKVEKPFQKITYDDAILYYGSDKPDLRNPLKIQDVTDVWVGSEFSIFNSVIKAGGVIRAIPAPNCSDKPRSFFDSKIEFAKSHGAKGLAYIQFDDSGEAKGTIAKFLSPERCQVLKDRLSLANGDSVFFTSGSVQEAASLAGKVRNKLGEELELLEKNVYKFCWVVDFPFYELNDEGKIDFSHNPFSMPQGGLEVLENAKTDTDLLNIKAFQYDIVCNGIELSSGAIRNHKPEIMIKAFEIAGYTVADIESKFSALFNAFKYGAPPHGGIAPGIDRILMMLTDEPNIREVICFPMNQKAQDLLMNAPSEVSDKQLRELHIKATK